MKAVRRENPAYGVLWSEFRLEGKEVSGAGQFVMQIEPAALMGTTPVATFAHAGELRIAVGIHPARQEIVVFFGGDGIAEGRHVYQIPMVTDGNGAHELETVFAEKKINEVKLNGEVLQKVPEVM